MVHFKTMKSESQGLSAECSEAALSYHCLHCPLIASKTRQAWPLSTRLSHCFRSLQYRFRHLKHKIPYLKQRGKVSVARASLIGLPTELRDQVYQELYNVSQPITYNTLQEVPKWLILFTKLSSVCKTFEIEISDFISRLRDLWQHDYSYDELYQPYNAPRLCSFIVQNIRSISIAQYEHLRPECGSLFPERYGPCLGQNTSAEIKASIAWFWKLHILASMPRLERISISFPSALRKDYQRKNKHRWTTDMYLFRWVSYNEMLDQLVQIQTRCSPRQHKVKLEVMDLPSEIWIEYRGKHGLTTEKRDYEGDGEHRAWWTEVPGADFISVEGMSDLDTSPS